MARFSGFSLTRWKDDRVMVLEEEFYFIDKKEKKWLAPKGAEINGATIPKSLWMLVGPPYVGPYRRATVVHDYFVGEGNNPNVSYSERRKADKMFFQACRVEGSPWGLAAKLYLGVSIGSWASRFRLKHSKFSKDMIALSIEEDRLLERKYDDLFARANSIISEAENFEALEMLVEKEIND